MKRVYNAYQQGSKKGQWALVGVLTVCLLIVGAVGWWFYSETRPVPDTDRSDIESVQNNNDDISTAEPTEQKEEPDFDKTTLRSVLDSWYTTIPASAKASVVVADKDGEVLAERNPDNVYFAASIYKLFVVYEAYLRVDNGTYSLGQTVAAGQDMKTCLDIIIRLSNTNEAQACAETLWTQQGKSEQTEILRTKYGLTNTSLVSIQTSAADTAKMLALIENGQELSDSSRNMYLRSMREQIHTKGFPSGIRNATVYEKVGFNGDAEYHDAAIVRLQDGRSLVVSVFTNGVGTAWIADLARRLEAVL